MYRVHVFTPTGRRVYDPLIREPEVDVDHPDVEVFCEVPESLKSQRDLDLGPDALDWNAPAPNYISLLFFLV